MRVQIRDRDALSSLSVLSLRTYLKTRQWVDEGDWGSRATLFSMEHEGRRWEILSPYRDTFADYAACMAEAVEILATVEERSQLDVFHDLAGAGADVIQMRSLNGVAKETLSLGQSAEMFGAAYDMLASAARAAEKPKAAYRGRISADVADYLDDVQPLPGFNEGYALTLHSRVPACIGGEIDFGDAFDAPFARRAAYQLATALDHANRAIGEAVPEDTLEPFRQAVQFGVSANLCDSVAALAKRGEGIEIALYWAEARPSVLPESHFRFTVNGADVLTEAAEFLRRNEPFLDERVVAQVVRLDGGRDEFDGRAVIAVLQDERFGRLKATFEESDFSKIIQAFDERKFICLSGDIHPVGNGYALRRPHNLSFVEDAA